LSPPGSNRAYASGSQGAVAVIALLDREAALFGPSVATMAATSLVRRT
jgi:hypothetical protein